MPALVVHKAGSMWHLAGNMGCFPALVNMRSHSELLSSKSLYDMIAYNYVSYYLLVCQ